jgi:hypothetical protein
MTNLSVISFIVTGMGRSGTKWLATILDQDEQIKVGHEPVKADVHQYYRPVTDKDYDAVKYCRWRVGKMKPPEGQLWGEVNSFLRYLVPALLIVFPTVPIIGLVRHPGKTINSMLARGIYAHPDRPPILAPVDMENEFARCCWYWADTYNRLKNQGIRIFRLEDLTASYPVFWHLLCIIGADVSEDIWEDFRHRRLNAGTRIDQPLGWGEAEWDTYNAFARPVAETLGYD